MYRVFLKGNDVNMEKTLDFKVIFYMLRKKIVWIIIATVLGALGAFLISEYMIPEKFTSSAQVYISNRQGLQTDDGINLGDLSAARSLASTYCVILKTDKAKDYLKEKLSSNEEYMSLPERSYNISVSVTEETEVLLVTVSSRNPKVSAIVCNTMLDVSVDLISEIFEGGRSHPLGTAYPNYNPTSPNVKTNMLLGAVAACVAVCVLIVLWSMLDNRVKDEQDFVTKVGIPVLGEVPSINDESEEREGYYYAYSQKNDD